MCQGLGSNAPPSLQSTCGLVGQTSGQFGAGPVYHNLDITRIVPLDSMV